MAERRVPDLEEMDEQEAHRFLTELFSNLSAQEEYELRHQDYVMEMPQSEESIRGREKMREFQEAYPTPPSIQLRRVLVRDGLWIVEGVNDYGGGQVFDVVLILELRDGKMWRDRRYYAEPFEAPEWRAEWVERMESYELALSPKRGLKAPTQRVCEDPGPLFVRFLFGEGEAEGTALVILRPYADAPGFPR